MDADELKDWQLCWQVNLQFSRGVHKPQKCIACSKITSFKSGVRRSSFWLDATRCSAGHRQSTYLETRGVHTLGVCADCDQMYMLDVAKGKQACRRAGCRRSVRIIDMEVKKRLEGNTALWERFREMLKKYRVFECVIHCDDVPYSTNSFLALKPLTPQCDHDRNVCDACTRTAFESAIRGGRHQDLACTDPECKKAIPLDVIRANVSGEVFKIYNKQLVLKHIASDKNFRWCSCGHGQIHGPGESKPDWTCLNCSQRHCFTCKDAPATAPPCAHLKAADALEATTRQGRRRAAARALAEAASQRSAAEARARAQQQAEEAAGEAATQREMARTTKRCPKAGCCNRIERNEGCGHFTCRLCRTEFCWACKVIWRGGTAQHLVGCRIGTRSQVARSRLDTSGYAPGWDKDEGYDLALDKGLWLVNGHM